MGIDYGGNTLWEKPYEELKTLAAIISKNENGSFCVASTNGHSLSLCSLDQTGELHCSGNYELDLAERMFDVWEHSGACRTLFNTVAMTVFP